MPCIHDDLYAILFSFGHINVAVILTDYLHTILSQIIHGSSFKVAK